MFVRGRRRLVRVWTSGEDMALASAAEQWVGTGEQQLLVAFGASTQGSRGLMDSSEASR
jgi:hypothetical protein